MRINKLRTKLLTAFIAQNTTYNRKNLDFKIINVADCKTCKNRLLAVENLILVIYNYPTTKTRTLYKSKDGAAGQPADNPPNSDGLGDFHRTVPKLMVQVYWKPGLPIWQRFGSDPDPDPKWQSRTVANTSSTTSPRGTSQTDTTCWFVSTPTSDIAGTPSPLSGPEQLPSPIANPEAHAIISNPMQTLATERNQTQRQRQLQSQAVSTPQSVASSSHSMHWFASLDMMRLVVATRRHLELYMWNTMLFMSASDSEIVSYTMRHVAKALAETLHWQIIATYWNTAMQQNNIWSIAFKAHTKVI